MPTQKSHEINYPFPAPAFPGLLFESIDILTILTQIQHLTNQITGPLTSYPSASNRLRSHGTSRFQNHQ